MAAPGDAPPGPSAQRRALDAADDIVLEYCAFRGFAEVFRALGAARKDDAEKRGAYDARFATDALLKPIQALDHAALLDAWCFLSGRFFRKLDAEMTAHAHALERGVYRAYCVAAVRRGARDKATELLAELARRDAQDAARRPPAAPAADVVWALYEDDAPSKPPPTDARNGARWREWFAMPHVARPDRDPLFAPYFKKEWYDALVVSLRNFLATVFAAAAPPKLLLLQTWHSSQAQQKLREELQSARSEREALEADLARTRATRDALAGTVRDLLVAHHHQDRASPSKPRGGLFDDDPADAGDARQAGADAVEAARRGGDDAALDALCAKAGRYLDLVRGGG